MTNLKIAEKIMEHIDTEVRELGDTDWIEVLEETKSNIQSQLNVKYEEQKNELDG